MFSNFLEQSSTEVLVLMIQKQWQGGGGGGATELILYFPVFFGILSTTCMKKCGFQIVFHLGKVRKTELGEILPPTPLVQLEQLHFYLFHVLGFQARFHLNRGFKGREREERRERERES